MKTNLKIATVALMAALSAPVMAEENKSPIVGAWQMTSLESAAADGTYSTVPYSGQVIFTEGGTLSVQASERQPGCRRHDVHHERLRSLLWPCRCRR